MTPRRYVVELALFAAEHGARGTRVNRLVTEGRDVADYSSCGDLLHCCAFAAGMRHPTINREEFNGWQIGVNLSRWLKWTKPPKVESIRPGDFLLLDGDTQNAHGCVALTRSAERILTADFGQPGGLVHDCRLTRSRLGAPLVRGRRLTHWISLACLPWVADPLTVGEYADAHGMPDVEALWLAEGKTFDDIASDAERDAADREGT